MSMSKRFLHMNEELLDQFMLYGVDGEELTLVAPIMTALGKVGTPVEAKAVVYQKKKVKDYQPTANGQTPSIHVVNKDGEYHTTLWETTPAKIELALRSGLINPDALEDSPIAQVIADYGQYLKIAAERVVTRKGLVSNKDAKKVKNAETDEESIVEINHKKMIVKFAQDAILKLQSLWECVNKYNESLTPTENLELILAKLSTLADDLHNLQDSIAYNVDDDANVRSFKEELSSGLHDATSYALNLRNKLKNKYCIQNQTPEDSGEVKVDSGEEKLEFHQNITKEQIKPMFEVTGFIGQAIQDQMTHVNAAAERANNRISGLYMRGDLFTCIKKAENHTRDMNLRPDYHNAAPRELSLLFDKSTPKDQLVTFDLVKHGAKVSTDADLALQLTLVDSLEERGELPKGTRIEGRSGINWSDWKAVNALRTGACFTAGIFGFVFGDVPFSIANGLSYLLTAGQYPLTKIFGYSPEEDGYPSEKLERRLLKNLRDPIKEAYADKIGAAVFEGTAPDKRLTKIVKRSLTSKINGFFATQLKKLTVAPVKEILWETPKNLFNGVRRIIYDWKHGTDTVSDAEITLLLQNKAAQADVRKQLQTAEIETYVSRFNKLHPKSGVELKEIPYITQKILEESNGKFPSLESSTEQPTGIKIPSDVKSETKNSPSTTPVEAKKQTDAVPFSRETYVTLEQKFHNRAHIHKKQFARAPYYLHRDKPNDVLSGSSDGWELLVKVFLDEIYRNHPVAGMGFTGLGFLGGLPFVAAGLKSVGFANTFFNHVSAPIAEALVGHTSGFTAGFSTGLIEGKLAFCFLDFVKRGPNSFIFNLVKDSLENPAVAAIAAGFSIAIGHLVAFELDIPVISEKLAEESTGTFPWPELGLAGIKFAGLLAEGLIDLSEEDERATQSQQETYRARLRKKIVESYLEKHPETTEENISAAIHHDIDTKTDAIIGWLEKNKSRADIINLVADSTKQFFTQVEVHFQDRFNREKINQLDFKKFSEQEKYRVMQWVQQKYQATDPEYVAVVHAKIYPKTKSSPVATTIQTAVSYIPDTLRLLNSMLQVIVYGVKTYGKKDKKYDQAVANLKFRGHLYANKVRADVGLLVRWTGKMLWINYLMLSATFVSAATIFIGALSLCVAPFEVLIRAIRSKRHSHENDTLKPQTTFHGFKLALHYVKKTWNAITQPKFFTRFFEAATGWFRKVATHKNIHAASRDIEKRKVLQAKMQNQPTMPSIERALIEKELSATNKAEMKRVVHPEPPTTTPKSDELKAGVNKSEAKTQKLRTRSVVVIEHPTATGNPDENKAASEPAITHHFSATKRPVGISKIAVDPTTATPRKSGLATQLQEEKERKASASKETGTSARPASLPKPPEPTQLQPIPEGVSSPGPESKTAVSNPSDSGSSAGGVELKSEPASAPEIQSVPVLMQELAAAFAVFTYSSETISDIFRGRTLFEFKYKCAAEIRDALTEIDFDRAIARIKREISLVSQKRHELGKTTTGDFEAQLNAALINAYERISLSQLPAEQRADALIKLQALIDLNQQGPKLIAVNIALKEFMAVKLPDAPKDEAPAESDKVERGDIAHIRDIQNKIRAVASDADLKNIWKAIRARDLNKTGYGQTEQLGVSEMHEQAVYLAKYTRKNKPLDNMHSLYHTRDFKAKVERRMNCLVETAYETLKKGLTTLSMQFANDPEMVAAILSCYKTAAPLNVDVDPTEDRNNRSHRITLSGYD